MKTLNIFHDITKVCCGFDDSIVAIIKAFDKFISQYRFKNYERMKQMYLFQTDLNNN